MKLAIGAIFRNEFDYIIEWLAWHEMAGFSSFYIADNGSTDGTRELLEALSDLSKINLIYQPIVLKQAQNRAYNRIAQLSIDEVEAILLIDADEFLIHDSMKDGEEYQTLLNLLEDEEVGMVGINWRCFGSSNLSIQDPRPVLERFTYCVGDKNSTSKHIKSISKTKFVKDYNAHSVYLSGSKKYIKSDQSQISDFITIVNGKDIETQASERRTKTITLSPLRINHYVIKSKEEYTLKKRKRGDATLGVNYDRGENFFLNHDFKEANFKFPEKKLQTLKTLINEYWNELAQSIYSKKIKGVIDVSNPEGIQGWLVDEKGNSKGLKVIIFVNSVYQESAKCGFYRPDLKEKQISTDGMSGFRYTHPAPLKSGDVVEVKVHANRYQFPQRARTVIE